MATPEQPPKKRKLYEAPATAASMAQPPPRSFVPPSPSSLPQEEVLRKRRNREEIRSLYEFYRRIRFSVSQKDSRRMPDLEQTYLSIIAASRGCSSGQRIVAELIPRYASYCPTALEAATRVAINMYNWNLSLILRGDDADGTAFQTAAACIFGFANICSTAASAEANSSIIGGICSTVFLNVLTFFISTFEGVDIYDIGDKEIESLQEHKELFSALKEKLVKEDGSPISKLHRFRVLSLLRIFFSCPRNLLQACFKIFDLNAADGEIHKGGNYFLKQITSPLSSNVVSQQTDGIYDGVTLSAASDDKHLKGSFLKSCLLGRAVSKDPSLMGWTLSRYKKLCELVSSQALSEISSSFEKLFKSFQEVIQETDGAEVNKSGYLNCISQQQVSKYSGGSDGIAEKYGMNCSSRINSSASIAACEFGKVGIETHGQSVECSNSVIKSGSESQSTNDNSNNDCEGSVSMRSMDTPEARPSMRQEMRASSRGVTNVSASPRQYPSLHHHNSYSASQIVWYYDGHSAAMDVFSASKQLWVGSLGHDASETLIRSLFEKFGQIEHFMFHPFRGFALVEYRHIMDAIKARQSMQGSSPWGSCLRVKFLDVGVGSGGSIHGAAIGTSCHVYIGSVSSQRAKDNILNGLRGAGVRPPRSVTYMTSENALLLEFSTAEEAALVMSHIRLQRLENGYCFISSKSIVSRLSSLFDSLFSKYNTGHLSKNHPAMALKDEDRAATSILWISMQNIADSYILDDDVMAICNLAVENVGSVMKLTRASMQSGFGWFVEFNSIDAAVVALKKIRACPNIFLNIDFRSPQYTSSHENYNSSGLDRPHMKHHSALLSIKAEVNMPELVFPTKKFDSGASIVQSEHAYQSNWTTSNKADMMDAKSGKGDGFADSSADGQAVSIANEQGWKHKRPEIQLQNPVSGSSTGPIAQSGSRIPPPVQTSAFIRPLYAPPNPWNPLHSPNPSPHMNHVRPSMIPTSHPSGSYPPRPFAPSVTPLAQISVSPVQPFGVALPGVPPMSSPPPPPPDMPPPLPPSPPPLPLSQPPSVPPPPSSPPPSQHLAEISKPESSRECLPWQWQGILCKSGVQYCTVFARRENSDLCKYTNGLSEPSDWPAKLDVTKRTDFRHVKSSFASTPPHKREICRLAPNSNIHHKGFQDFVSYLKQKECAGVIKIPAGTSMWPRLLFILPYSLDTCSLLSISPEPVECLIAVVLPKETNFDWL